LSRLIPYGHQCIDEDDIQAVVEVLRSDWITTWPKVVAFEKAVAEFVSAEYGAVVSNGTAALHAAVCHSLGDTYRGRKVGTLADLISAAREAVS
jgi:perosamine synthetase